MHIKTFFAACLLLVSSPGIWAQQVYGNKDPSAKPGGTITIGLATEPPNLDPFHQAGDARTAITVLMYQGLMYEDAGGVALPLLAEKVSLSKDQLTYTFSLRRNVRFHTGQRMTAADVKYSYDYVRNPANGSPGAADFQSIAEIRVVDENTVAFQLAHVNAGLPMVLTNRFAPVVPRDYFAQPNAKARLNDTSVGTGPFRLKQFAPNSSIKLEKFPEYWEAGAPHLDGIQFSILPNSTAVLAALKTKRVDLALLARPQDSAQLKSVAGLNIAVTPSLRQHSLDLDGNFAQLKDARVRQAIALAIDKAQVMQAGVGGNGQVTGTTVAAMQKNWGVPLDQLPNQKPDIERAKKLLAEAGLGSGFSIDLTTIIGFDWMDPAALVVAQQLQGIGIQTRIVKTELGVWLQNFRAHKMGFTFNDWGTQPDPNILYYRHYHSPPEGADFRNWNNAEGNRLLDEAQRTHDEAKRKKLYMDFQRIFASSVPTIMLYSPNLVTVTTERVRNYTQHPTGWYFGLVRSWIQQ